MGRVVDLHSSKDMGMDRAIERLVSLGSVSVIATDVSPVPGFVSRMAGKLGAVVYEPEESALVFDKIVITRGYRTEDAHQRDSLAAALTAYASYRNKFVKIDSMGMDSALADEVKHLVIRGVTIEKARLMVEERGHMTAEEEKRREAPKHVLSPGRSRNLNTAGEWPCSSARMSRLGPGLQKRIWRLSLSGRRRQRFRGNATWASAWMRRYAGGIIP